MKYKHLCKKEQIDAQALCRDIEKEMLSKDIKIARWLGLKEEQGIVCLIRKLLEFHDWIESKKACKQKVTLEETKFFDESKSKESVLHNSDAKLDKKMLLLAECGITDYGIEEKKVHIKKDNSTSVTLNEKRIRTKEEPQLEKKRRCLEDIKGKYSDEMILTENDILEDKKPQEVEYITS